MEIPLGVRNTARGPKRTRHLPSVVSDRGRSQGRGRGPRQRAARSPRLRERACTACAGARRVRTRAAWRIRFPDGFTWGTATAAHQIEGNNVNSDFWVMEHTPGHAVRRAVGRRLRLTSTAIRTTSACCASSASSAYRFSVEWARVEPEEGWFSLAALDHYRRMLASCHEHGVRPVRHLPSLHLAALVHRRRRLGGARATSTASCATASAPCAISAI